MAYRAGAEMIDMEMVQFAPGLLIWPTRFKANGVPYILDLLLGEHEGELLNSRGERFMEKYDPERMEHTSKEIWSLAIVSEVLAGRGTPHGGVWWSFKGVDKNRIKEIADREKGRVLWEGGAEEIIQMALDGVDYEIGAAAHYMIGGIRVNGKTETNVAGLYAAGECKGNLWGATRVASAITEVIVEGRSSGAIAADYARHCPAAQIDWEQVEAVRAKTLRPLENTKGLSPIELRKSIQRIADDKVHVIRNGKDLKKAVQELEQLKDQIANNVAVKGAKTRSYNPEWIEAIQLENLRQCLELTALSSLHREESRGAQYRTDYRNCDNVKWLNNTVVRLESGSRKISSEPIVTTKITPPRGVMTYEEALGLELASLKGKTKEER
jgi:succinate dehydrogenase/fumarate reductase flavoprotein subunit